MLAITAALACLKGVSSVSEQEHALLTLDARGALSEDRRMLLRREGRERLLVEEEVAASAQVGATPSFCSNGGTSRPTSALDFSPGIPTPQTAPFTLALRVKFHGSPTQQVDAPIIMWTIDKDTTPSRDKSQFYQGHDGQPPRIALMREGNAILYEEYGSRGFNALISDPSQHLNDSQYHDVVLVRNSTKIALWVDNQESEHVNLHQEGFRTQELPHSSPARIYGQKASSENGYFKEQFHKIADFGHQNITRGKWAFDGEVRNVRLYEGALHAHEFPDSSTACPTVQCDTTCATCTGTAATDCTSCTGIRHLFQGACDFTCPRGYYIHHSQNECKPCGSGCGGCSGPSTCTSCNNLLLYDGICTDKCPENTAQNDNDECENIVGSVVVVSHEVNGASFVLEAQGDRCIGQSSKSDTSGVKWPPEQQWIVGSAGTDVVSLRNVKTGKFLDMYDPSAFTAETAPCGSSTLAQCIHESTTRVENTVWAENSCSGSEFKFMFVGQDNIFAIHNSRFSRFVQYVSGVVDRSVTDATSVSLTAAYDLKRRWTVFIEHSPFQVEIKYAGKCTTPVSSAVACQQAAATTQIFDYADFQETIDDPAHPPNCHFYEETVDSGSDEDQEYTDYPKKIRRLLFNRVSATLADQAGALPSCSGDEPCLCVKAA